MSETNVVTTETINETSVQSSPLNDVFSDDVIKNLDLFKKDAQIKDIENFATKLTNYTNKPLYDANKDQDVNNMIDYLDKILEDYTVEQLNKLTPEEVEKIYNIDAEHEGEDPIHIDINTEKGKSEFEMQRDYLVLRKETAQSMKELKDATNELQDYMKEYTAEMEELANEFGSVDKYIVDTLTKKIEENTEDSDRIELYKNILSMYTNASTLENIINYVESYRGKNVLADFLDHKGSMRVYNKYRKICAKCGIEQDITRYASFESYLYDATQLEEKKIRMNIFMFSVMHFIASQRYDELDQYFGIFISQLVVNIKNVIYNNFPDSDSKFVFMDAVRRIVEVIG